LEIMRQASQQPRPIFRGSHKRRLLRGPRIESSTGARSRSLPRSIRTPSAVGRLSGWRRAVRGGGPSWEHVSHPPRRNIEWREVVSLLGTIGTVTHQHNGKLKVALGPETEVLPAPHGKDVDVQIVVAGGCWVGPVSHQSDPPPHPIGARRIRVMVGGASRLRTPV